MKIRSDTENWLKAYDWLCRSRIRAGHNADIWDLRFHWPAEQQVLFRQVAAGTYRLSPMRIIRHPPSRESQAQWSTRDALVLK